MMPVTTINSGIENPRSSSTARCATGLLSSGQRSVGFLAPGFSRNTEELDLRSNVGNASSVVLPNEGLGHEEPFILSRSMEEDTLILNKDYVVGIPRLHDRR